MLSSEDVRENPGTLALAGSWGLIFALMLLVQWLHPVPLPKMPIPEPLPISTATSHRFGDMTWFAVRHGQPWRLVTATFVHFGLIHVALNGLAMLNLGRLIEPWYRTGPFLAVCLAIGGLGNLLGGALRQFVAVARPWLAWYAGSHHWPGLVERTLRGHVAPGVAVSIPTGGGSTILLGLLALAAVVGWRAKTRIGSHLRKQMLLYLGLTAVLGLAMSNLVDNYGHLGGAIVGAAFGLADRPIFRLSDGRKFRASCLVAASCVALACFGQAIRSDYTENRLLSRLAEILGRQQAGEKVGGDLDELFRLYAGRVIRQDQSWNPNAYYDMQAEAALLAYGPTMSVAQMVPPEQAARELEEMGRVLDRLDGFEARPWGEAVAGDIDRVRALGRLALDDPQTYEQVYEFVVCWKGARKVIEADLRDLKAALTALEKAAR